MDSEYHLFILLSESKMLWSDVNKQMKHQHIQNKFKKQISESSPYYTNKHLKYLVFCRACKQVFQMQPTIYEEEKDKILFAREYLYDEV